MTLIKQSRLKLRYKKNKWRYHAFILIKYHNFLCLSLDDVLLTFFMVVPGCINMTTFWTSIKIGISCFRNINTRRMKSYEKNLIIWNSSGSRVFMQLKIMFICLFYLSRYSSILPSHLCVYLLMMYFKFINWLINLIYNLFRDLSSNMITSLPNEVFANLRELFEL